VLIHLPNWFAVPLLKYVAWPFFVHPGSRRRARQKGRKWIIPMIARSARQSVWMFDAIRLLNRSTGFGRMVVKEERVATLNLEDPALDNVILVGKAIEAARVFYPNLRKFTYRGPEHGTYEIEGREVSTALEKIRAHAARILDLPPN
jgi:hypothetical protein